MRLLTPFIFLLFCLSCGLVGVSDPVSEITFTSLSAGSVHTCEITARGTAYCWGGNNRGQLGTTAVLEKCEDPFTGIVDCSTRPMAVSGELTVASLSAGASHTCGITTSGPTYCWGSNRSGSGTCTARNGTTVPCSRTPVLLSGGVTFTALSTKYSATCGIATSGAAYCLGPDLDVPPEVVAGGLVFASLTRGLSHTCGITTGGTTYCWGGNLWGQLGNGTYGGGRDDPQDYRSPGAVVGGLTFGLLSAGWRNTLGLTDAGAAYWWGKEPGYESDVGIFPNSSNSANAPTPVAGGLTFVSLTAGSGQACGITPGGAAYCWGSNTAGQLGDGTSNHQKNALVPVSGGLTFALLSAGDAHTCGLTTDGTAYCWGYNTVGQLGDGSTNQRHTPVRVVGQP